MRREGSPPSTQLHWAALKSFLPSIGCLEKPCLLGKLLLLSECVTNETSRKETYGLTEEAPGPQIASPSEMRILTGEDLVEDTLPSSEPIDLTLRCPVGLQKENLRIFPQKNLYPHRTRSGMGVPVGEARRCWVVQETRVTQDKVYPAWPAHSEWTVSPKSR